MQQAETTTAFDLYHPAVPAVFFLLALAFCMLSFQPVFIAISVTAALLYSVFLRGWRQVLRGLAWQIPLLVIIAVLNPLFSQQGSTELFRIFGHAYYGESLAYGLCMGGMLVGVILWFGAAAQVLTSDKTMSLTGNVFPTIGLMMCMIMRLVPSLAVRGGQIAGAAKANTAARRGKAVDAAADGTRRGKDRWREPLRRISVLMGWAMEDSLESADSMRARGWGAAAKRSTYRRSRIRRRDAVALAVLAALAAVCAECAWAACTQFVFFPRMPRLIMWWGYFPYTVLTFAPLLLEVPEALKWRLQ